MGGVTDWFESAGDIGGSLHNIYDGVVDDVSELGGEINDFVSTFDDELANAGGELYQLIGQYVGASVYLGDASNTYDAVGLFNRVYGQGGDDDIDAYGFANWIDGGAGTSETSQKPFFFQRAYTLTY